MVDRDYTKYFRFFNNVIWFHNPSFDGSSNSTEHSGELKRFRDATKEDLSLMLHGWSPLPTEEVRAIYWRLRLTDEEWEMILLLYNLNSHESC